jgi:ABC-type branched-subunit amino acid transport system ATPase component
LFDGRDHRTLARRSPRLGVARSFQIMTLFDEFCGLRNVRRVTQHAGAATIRSGGARSPSKSPTS